MDWRRASLERKLGLARLTARGGALSLLIVALVFSGLSLAGGSGCMIGARPPRALGAYESIAYYQDGFPLPSSEKPDYRRDVKRISATNEHTQLTDYPKGYAITVPAGMEFDFTCSPDFTRIYGEDLEIRISRDSSPYLDVTGWLNSLPNEFILDEGYRKANDITVNEDGWTEVGGHNARIYSLTRTPRPESKVLHNSYTYAYIKTVRDILDSLVLFNPEGVAVYSLDLEPVIPGWSDETRAVYESIRSRDSLMWGFFTPNPFSPEGWAKVKEVEAKLEFEFPVIMWYRYLGHEFPVQELLQEAGRLVELTLQVADDMYGRNPCFEILDGRLEEDIRMFARGAKEFGKPFLMRLNNEMNSTWVSYSGHLCLNDPDIFKAVWRRIYDIFREEGVDNAIWIWNPHDQSFPPCLWNSHVAYYPGNEYVQMVGLTVYNSGTYFRDVTGERWRSFTEIYDRLWEMYKDLYAEFPWIITEFASSSVGGDKKAWIDEMFDNISRYTNIKIAVWWSYYDPDPREATYGTPARRYWLDEKPEYLEAFKKGLERTGQIP